MIPLGGAAKEHGPHLPLNADWIQAEYYKKVILERADVVMAPTISYSYYPSFLEYPGSVSIRFLPTLNTIIDICESFARYGPRRFFVINMGVSTSVPLSVASEILAKKGIILWRDRGFEITKDLEWIRNVEGTHANEVETSVLLFMAPSVVDMKKAVRDFDSKDTGGLTRDPNGSSPYSPTGVWGDATKATREKGRQVVKAQISKMLYDIEELRKKPLPPGKFVPEDK